MTNDCQKVYISKEVYASIKNSIGSMPAETGGMLGMRNNTISSFYYDVKADTSCSRYLPDNESCSRILNEQWFPNEIKLCGFIHSHNSVSLPSKEDKLYTKQIYDALLEYNKEFVDDFYLLIATKPKSTDFSISAYRVDINNKGMFNLVSIDLVID